MNDEVAVSIWLLYGGTKAEFFSGLPNNVAVTLLLEDLLRLKLPHPKRENIEFISGRNNARGCSFFWPRVPFNGLLHKQLKVRTRPTHEFYETHQRLLESLSMYSIYYANVLVELLTYFGFEFSVSLTCKERPVVPTNQIPRKLSSQAKALPRHANKQWAQYDENSNSSGSITIPIKVDEAEELLNNMALSFQSGIRIPKLEPVDPPSLFDALPFPRDDSVASSRPSMPPEVILRPLPAQNTQITMESEPLAAPSVRRPPESTPYSIHSTPMSISPLSSALPDPKPKQPTVPTPSIRTSTPEFSPPGFAKIQPVSPTIPRKRPLTPDPETELRSVVRPPPNPSDVPTIQKLTQELWDLRRQVTAGVARETAIIRELRTLNSTFVPEPSIQVKSSEVLATKTRLEAVENELRAERKKREEAEIALNDIERECRDPFVVPALFDAFVSISRITSQAMEQEP
ncbi:hypothetical protein BDZ94DRAFT_1296168 [Collybia nuda]|uniref:Uncharacterized protein n=1 Tax=Collybia nuda TaxID=64659 RepID=A0A9P5Y9S4_9AGAR|nr:hypothetical protein BDZ94DRAFT_1296168 [Collybia nuda]